MIARGPTLAGDGGTATGSVHILGLPGPAAARAFALTSPTTRPACTGTCCWPVAQPPGRTMRDFPGGPDGGNRYLVLGLGTGQAAALPRRPPGTS